MKWNSGYTVAIAIVMSIAFAFLATPSLALTIAGMWGALGIAELAALQIYDKTVSQVFWEWKDDPETPKWKVYAATIGGIGIPVLILILHLILAI